MKSSEVLKEERRALYAQAYAILDQNSHERHMSATDHFPRTRNGNFDRRSPEVRRWLETEALAVPLFAAAHAKDREVAEAEAREYLDFPELSKRQYPKAIRPQLVFNSAGAWMQWDRWINSTDMSELVGMRFEDGSTVGDVSSDARRRRCIDG